MKPEYENSGVGFTEEVSQGADSSVNFGDLSGDEVKEILPCVPLRGVTIFPNTVIHFDIGREKSIRALERAMATDKLMFVSSQKDDKVLIPTVADIYPVGTVVRVKQMLKIQGDAVRVLVEGLERATIDECISEDSYIACTVNRVHENFLDDDLSVETKARIRLICEQFEEYANVTSAVSDDVVGKTLDADGPAALIDGIANETVVNTDKKQMVLGELDFAKRVEALSQILAEEIDIARLEKEMAQKVRENIDNGQRDYYLRERIRVLQGELGNDEDVETETANWLDQLDQLHLEPKTDEKVRKEISKYAKMQPSSAESAVVRNYVETILELPWNTSSETNQDIRKAEEILEADHYGLKKVKERILEYLAVTHLSNAIRGPILCLVGPPGVGKTSVAKSIAHATGREYVRMSLGGVRDEAEIRGHRRTYIGAIPGRIINAIKEAGTNNPLFLLDEVDKLGADYRGDPASALLEVFDPEQNNTFTDHFLEVPFDLSKVMFITTANNADTIPRPLLDRMELIEVPGYTEVEKVKIADQYLVPKEIKENGLKPENLKISDSAIHDIVNYYTRESGVRNLEREIANLCRKIAKRVVSEGDRTYRVNSQNLTKYLGKHRFLYDLIEDQDQAGLVTGLAWTEVGGVTLQTEVTVLPGDGKLKLTGQLGDVMKESAEIGYSYIRANADRYGIDPEFFKNHDLHIHLPEGAVPKDGPSAGVTMITAMISAITGEKVRRDVAMTGEVSLRGHVLPIGGLREKTLAAHRAGIKTVVIPHKNEPDMDDIPASVKRDLTFVLADRVDDVLDTALTEGLAGLKKAGKKSVKKTAKKAENK